MPFLALSLLLAPGQVSQWCRLGACPPPASCRAVTRQISVRRGTCSAVLEAELVRYSPLVRSSREPADPPHKRRYKRCALVSNGGVLLGSGCGRSIDRNDAVFRVNTPILKGFERDVGVRTTHRLLNTPETRRQAWNDVGYDPTLTTISLISPSLGGVIKSWATLQGIERVWMPNKNSMHDLRRFWRAQNSTMRTTAGLQTLLHAATVCDTVTMYGFSNPQPLAPGTKPHPYHFWWKEGQTSDLGGPLPNFDNSPPIPSDSLRFGDPFGAQWHDWSLEHKVLDRMAEAGRNGHGICMREPKSTDELRRARKAGRRKSRVKTEAIADASRP
ncbi:glycosyltransferase family 29-domain-containing protein [Pavlovales sp. CCMP2436]|nr:glycosyltransferase family 29-domain-containing protein [Pavlovales sp. CCMP2436]